MSVRIKTTQTIGHECGAHPFQMCPHERAGCRLSVPPDAPGRLAIALCSMMRPSALLPVPFASASGSPGVPESSTLTYTAKGKVSGLEP